MALTLVHDCPHCFAGNIGFRFLSGHALSKNKYKMRAQGEGYYWYERIEWAMLFVCNGCVTPICVKTVSNMLEGDDALQESGNIKTVHGFSDLEIYPTSIPIATPEHIPETIANAFLQAEKSLRQKSFDAAVAMDRRALELLTKDKAPEDAKKNLIQRIEILGARHQITPDLKDWAHNLRTMGNEAVHGVDGLTDEEATATHELTKFILIYVYTLPEQVRLAKEKRAAAKQE